MTYDVHHTRVLIIGGGLVGLCASLFLTQHGVPSVLAERRLHTSPQPKARRISIRTMELFRQFGIDGAVGKAAAALADFQGMSAGPTLALARPLPFRPPGGAANWADCSPVTACLCAQDALEPVLRELADSRGGDLRFGTEMLDFAPDADGVTATLRGADGSLTQVRADYLIAADGAHSQVRDQLGIPRSGHGILNRLVNVYVRADLADLVRGREFNLCQIEDPRAPGVFASINGTDRWIFGTAPCPGRTTAGWARTVSTAIGVPGIPVEVLSVMEWESGMFVADRFSQDRMFLAGDAAHVMPPYAALGANTGIQDAHNLAWKLALVLAGAAGPGLLDSYHSERHPAGWFVAEQSSIRSGNLRQMQDSGVDGRPLADPLALTFGCQYTSGAVIGDGSTMAVDHLDLRGQPGTRLPHRWLADQQRSTLDLVADQMTLLTGPAGTAWGEAAAAAGVEVRQVDLTGGDWERSVGIGAGGALLVRPDQVIAWRCRGPAAEARAELADVLRRLLGRWAARSLGR
jgi:2-polyprenyl-6-methoxyphenol hydroxylase-like FAD-dependent oxidoreductase